MPTEVNCPYCKESACKVESTVIKSLRVDTEGSSGTVCYDEPVYHFMCSNKHTFYGKPQEDADREAEEARAHD